MVRSGSTMSYAQLTAYKRRVKREKREQQAAMAAARGSGLGWCGTLWLVCAGSGSMGAGLLGLPSAFQALGWLPAFACLALFGTAAGYTSLLLARLAAAHPSAPSLHALGALALGPGGSTLVAAAAYTPLLLLPAVLHLLCSQALRQVMVGLGGGLGDQPSLLVTGCLVALLALPLAQVQQLSQVRWLAALGCAVLASAVALVGWQLGDPEERPEAGAVTELVAGGPFPARLLAVLTILYVVSGQDHWVTLMAAMHSPSQFPHAACGALALLTPLAALLGSFGYATLGGHLAAAQPITSLLQPGPWLSATNVCVLASCLTAYLLRVTVAAKVLLSSLCAPQQPDKSENALSKHGLALPARSTAGSDELAQPLLFARRAGPESDDETPTPTVKQRASYNAWPAAAPEDPSSTREMDTADTTPASRTESEAVRDLGTGIVLSAMLQHIGEENDASQNLAAGSTSAFHGAGDCAGTMDREASLVHYTVLPVDIEAPGVVPTAPQPLPLTGAGAGVGLEAGVGSGSGSGAGLKAGSGSGAGAGAKTASEQEAARASAGSVRSAVTSIRTKAASPAGLSIQADPGASPVSAGNRQQPAPFSLLLWALATSILVLGAWGLSHAVPDLAKLTAVTTSLGGASALLLCPCLISLRLLRLGPVEAGLCVLLCAASLALSAAGTYVALQHQG